MNVKHRPTSACYSNADFTLIATCSGYRSYALDADHPQSLLPVDVGDEEVGQHILLALGRSRQIPIEDIETFLDPERAIRSDDEWVAGLMRRYGYRSQRALFKAMKNCGIQCSGDVVRFVPMRQVKLEEWQSTAAEGAGDVVVAGDSSPEEVGTAFRLALSRCS